MGWLFSSRWTTRAEMVAYLRRQDRFVEGYSMLRSSVVGNHHWYLVKREADGAVYIGLDLMQGSKPGHPGWGYKDLDETMGPCEVDCPQSFLAQASAPEGYAAEWRERVRKHHAQKAATPKPACGLEITYGPTTYRLERSLGPRKGWRVSRVSDGHPFRMNARQIAQALRSMSKRSASTACTSGAHAQQASQQTLAFGS